MGRPLAWVSYLVPLGEGELLNLHWDPIVLLQTGPIEMLCTWNGTLTIKRGEKVRVLAMHLLPPVHILTPDSVAALAIIWYARPGQVPEAANLPLLKAGWALLFPTGAIIWPLSFPRLEDVITHIEDLTEFTQQDLNDSQQSPSLLNTEMSLRKAVLRNKMALDIVTALQGGTCAIIQTDAVYLYLMSWLMLSLVGHMRTHVKALIDLTSNLGDLASQWFRSWGFLWRNYLFGNHYLNQYFLLNMPTLVWWNLPPVQPDDCQK